MWKRVIKACDPGELPVGHCPDCNDKYDESMKEFGKTYRGVVPVGKPDTDHEPEPEMEEQLSVAVDDEPLPERLSLNDFEDDDPGPMPSFKERDDDERDEYWR